MSTALSPLPQASTSQLIAERIRAAILEGDLAPGDRIVEADLAERFEISRGPVREALRLLAPEGLLELRRNRGAIVASPTFQDVVEVYAVRMSLGSLALTQAIHINAPQHPDFPELLKKFALLSDSTTQSDPLTMMNTDLQFQGALLALGDLPRITSILDQSAKDAASFVRMLGISYDPADYSALIARHERTLHAVQIGSVPNAVSSWQDHIKNTVAEFTRGYPDAHETTLGEAFSHPLIEQLFDNTVVQTTVQVSEES